MAENTERDAKKWAVVRRAQFALKTALDRIDFTEDVVKPELEAIKSGTKKLSSSGDSLVDAKKALDEAS